SRFSGMRPSLATRLKTNNAGEQNARSKPTEGLKQACDAAYEANKNSCSHAVISVIRSVYDANMPHKDANGLIAYVNTKWTEVNLDDAFYIANLGHIVVGGKKETDHGHVIVVYPGDKIMNGGYQYYWKAGKKNLT